MTNDEWRFRLPDIIRHSSFVILSLAVVCLTGCGGSGRPKTVPISGKVTINGQAPGEGGKSRDSPEPRGGHSHQHQRQPGPEKLTKCSSGQLLAGESGVGSRMGKRDFTQNQQEMQQTCRRQYPGEQCGHGRVKACGKWQ